MLLFAVYLLFRGIRQEAGTQHQWGTRGKICKRGYFQKDWAIGKDKGIVRCCGNPRDQNWLMTNLI
jgi:hypothetical protein